MIAIQTAAITDIVIFLLFVMIFDTSFLVCVSNYSESGINVLRKQTALHKTAKTQPNLPKKRINFFIHMHLFPLIDFYSLSITEVRGKIKWKSQILRKCFVKQKSGLKRVHHFNPQDYIGYKFQILLAYSFMVRSLEKYPLFARFSQHLRAKSSG